MSFNTSISGLNAAQKDLNVTSNNIANAKSTGFKKSRAEFGDIYAVSAFGNSKTAVGQGVLNQAVTQQFSQGNLEFTDNSLDLAISGQGFFAFQKALDNSEAVFTRAGALGVNKNGYLVNQSGEYLQALPVNENGTLQSTSLATASPVQLPVAAGAPQATTEAAISVNLPAGADTPPVTTFDPDDPDSYNQANSQRIYDSLGNPHTLTSYFVKNDPAVTGVDNQWSVYYQIDDQPVADMTQQTVEFNTDGSFSTADANPVTVSETGANLGTGAGDLSIAMTFRTDSTQYNGPFNVADQSADGNTTGQLTGISVGTDGLIRASYTNGETIPLGKVALVDFRNPQGLKQVGDNSWIESIDSGEPLGGEAGSGTFGAIQGGALEASNVDLTAELVNLITAQRNFQANSRAIEANKTLSDTIIGIR
ncbi:MULTISPECIES: flagellar hook protein FlgE [unclassified Guyparkeria]|uniref:flagellar hook protein FlgE n=1 Tax=unclassified Guyparkeria TaxID=2626246 RepID=UPI0007336E1E|nr:MULTISPECIES: flagellar hook protein FlgE [unclassified Guyparkeria]KTG16065.1 flagellar biosynthesis protein FlgE [Guyparkeria sp. XI15]OAE84916.1 flagellar biosynthesis protein FlgE [Guyparkeria sp. WRN-7]